MTSVRSATDTSNLQCLADLGTQVLEQLPPTRHSRHLLSTVRELPALVSQPLRLTLIGKPVDGKLFRALMQASTLVELRRTSAAELLASPHALQELARWSEVTWFASTNPQSQDVGVTNTDPPTDTSQPTCTVARLRLMHCFRNPIVQPDGHVDSAMAQTVCLRWPFPQALSEESTNNCTAESIGESTYEMARVVRSLKQFVLAQRMLFCARQTKQLHAQATQHFKSVLGHMEKPGKSAITRAATMDGDKLWLPMRDRFAERLAALERDVVTASERATQPLGELSGMLRAIANGITVDDLESNSSRSQLKLSLNAGHLATLNRRFEHTLHTRFTGDLRQAERKIRQSMEESYRQSAELPPLNSSRLLPLDISRAWLSVENLMAIGKEAAIELPRKGVFDLLTAGRQKVFIIIMFVSLMGRMGLPKLFTSPAAQLGFGVFMASVMIASMISAISRWRKENSQTIDKEIQKFREGLLAEGSKVIDQVERTKLNAVREYCKEAARQFEALCRAHIESSIRQQQARAEELEQRLNAARKVLEGRLKQCAEAERSVQQWVNQAESYVESCWRCPAASAEHVPAPNIVAPKPTSSLAERRLQRLAAKSLAT